MIANLVDQASVVTEDVREIQRPHVERQLFELSELQKDAGRIVDGRRGGEAD